MHCLCWYMHQHWLQSVTGLHCRKQGAFIFPEPALLVTPEHAFHNWPHGARTDCVRCPTSTQHSLPTFFVPTHRERVAVIWQLLFLIRWAAHTTDTTAICVPYSSHWRDMRRHFVPASYSWEQCQEVSLEENVEDAALDISPRVLQWTVSALYSPWWTNRSQVRQLGTCHTDDNGEGDLHPSHPQGSLLSASHLTLTSACTPTLSKM